MLGRVVKVNFFVIFCPDNLLEVDKFFSFWLLCCLLREITVRDLIIVYVILRELRLPVHCLLPVAGDGDFGKRCFVRESTIDRSK